MILKVTKNQDFSLSLEDTLFEKPQGVIPQAVLGLASVHLFMRLDFVFKRRWTMCSKISRVSFIQLLFVSFMLQKTSWSVWIIMAIFNQILHRHYNNKVISIINLSIVYVSYAFQKWRAIYICSSSTRITTCCCYIACYKNICVWS